MKKLFETAAGMIFGLVVFLCSLFMLSQVANAANTQEAFPIRNVYSTTNVGSTAYVQLVASTVKGIAGMSIWNSGSEPVEIALGASGSEVVQLIVPALSSSTVAPAFYPMQAGYGSRISVISLGGPNTSGELEINLFYN